ncbi:MAG TPA: hypothetical protein VKU85_17885, partial [bacterium]|nr:hypothetical protein [bacterium]
MGVARPRLFLRDQLAVPTEVSCGAGRAFVFTCPSPERESPQGNEDGALALHLDGERGLLAVADGVGGGPGGGDAAAAALTTLAEQVVTGVERGDELRVAVLDGIERAQERVRGLGG